MVPDGPRSAEHVLVVIPSGVRVGAELERVPADGVDEAEHLAVRARSDRDPSEGESNGPNATLPPSSTTRGAAASVSSTLK